MGLNYIGSKLSLLNFINTVVEKEIEEEINVVGDLFAGTGIVGQFFKRKGYKIVSNDIQYYSFVMNKKFIGVNNFLKFEGLKDEIKNITNLNGKELILEVINYLNNLKEVQKGFIYNNYSLSGTKGKEYERQYFSDENALKIDTIRIKLNNWYQNNKINEKEFFYLLGTLLEASDKVANTASVYGAFLKHLKKSAQKTLELEYNEIIESDKNHCIFNDDIIKILNNEKIDLLYLDPPYNARQYCSNYHMLETIAKYDNPDINGKTGLRDYSKEKSLFCSKRTVKEEFKKIVQKTNAKYILLSYNNEGLMSIEDVHEIMSIRGKPKTYTLQYKRFKADKTENRNHKADSTKEYLHFVKCEYNNLEPDKDNYETIDLTIDDLN